MKASKRGVGDIRLANGHRAKFIEFTRPSEVGDMIDLNGNSLFENLELGVLERYGYEDWEELEKDHPYDAIEFVWSEIKESDCLSVIQDRFHLYPEVTYIGDDLDGLSWEDLSTKELYEEIVEKHKDIVFVAAGKLDALYFMAYHTFKSIYPKTITEEELSEKLDAFDNFPSWDSPYIIEMGCSDLGIYWEESEEPNMSYSYIVNRCEDSETSYYDLLKERRQEQQVDDDLFSL